jgi:hypothetical protein
MIKRYKVTLIKDWDGYPTGTVLNGIDQKGYDDLIKKGCIVDDTKPKPKKEIKKENNTNK